MKDWMRQKHPNRFGGNTERFYWVSLQNKSVITTIWDWRSSDSLGFAVPKKNGDRKNLTTEAKLDTMNLKLTLR